MGIQRYAGWPGADGQIHVSIFTESEAQTNTLRVLNFRRAALDPAARALGFEDCTP